MVRFYLDGIDMKFTFTAEIKLIISMDDDPANRKTILKLV
jgi:hypothetical protein